MPGWQGLWTDLAGVQSGYAFLVNRNPIRNRARRIVNRESFRPYKQLFSALIGAASGGASGSATHKRIGHPTSTTVTQPGDLGGLRNIDVITDMNRTTTAADVTNLKEIMVNVRARPTTYVRDLSGNGGPAFT